MKILYIILSAFIPSVATPAVVNELETIYEGKGATTYEFALDELGEYAQLSWESNTFWGYTQVTVSDTLGNEVYNLWGFGLLYFRKEKTLDLRGLEGKQITVQIKGRATEYSFSLDAHSPNSNK